MLLRSLGRPEVRRKHDMYAIIEDSGTQIKVHKGVAGGSAAKIGLPYLSGASVTAKVLGEADGPKVLVGKYKRRKGYRKTIGHKQHYTRIEVLSINA